MNVAGIRVKVSHFITLMLSAVVAACSKSTMLVTIGFIRASSSCRLASLATAITFALPFCAVFAEAIYVANSGNGTLSKFDASGQYVSTLRNRGPGYDPYFSGPSAIAIRAVPAPSSVPEIDPNSIGSVLALVLGSLGLLERRRLQAA